MTSTDTQITIHHVDSDGVTIMLDGIPVRRSWEQLRREGGEVLAAAEAAARELRVAHVSYGLDHDSRVWFQAAAVDAAGNTLPRPADCGGSHSTLDEAKADAEDWAEYLRRRGYTVVWR